MTTADFHIHLILPIEGIAGGLPAGLTDNVVGLTDIGVVAGFANFPNPLITLAVTEGKLLVKHQLGAVPGAGDIDRELSADGAEAIFK